MATHEQEELKQKYVQQSLISDSDGKFQQFFAFPVLCIPSPYARAKGQETRNPAAERSLYSSRQQLANPKGTDDKKRGVRGCGVHITG